MRRGRVCEKRVGVTLTRMSPLTRGLTNLTMRGYSKNVCLCDIFNLAFKILCLCMSPICG